METQDILLLISLGIIVLWTTRLARSKGLNPWMWGIGAVMLIALAWNFSPRFLGLVVMVPLIFLLLFRSPLFRRNREPQVMPCPSCGAADTGGLNFCVQCGWDLSRTGADPGGSGQETTVNPEGPVELQPIEPTEADEPQPAPAEEPVPQPVSQTDNPPEPVVEPVPEPVLAQDADPSPEPVLAQDADPAPVETSPAPVAESPQPPPLRAKPTAANLTERGVSFFNQGRYQEAIDQFTKAIALDPQYREAWEKRAEAYGRLGRSERQKADLRRLEAI